MNLITQSPLGQKSSYISQYQPDLLFAIPRTLKRSEIGVPDILPFKGYDVWNAFEISWLNLKGKPIVALGEFIFPCESPHLIESKSFKLYLNSFNNSKFNSWEEVAHRMQQDLSAAAGVLVKVNLISMHSETSQQFQLLQGFCLDDLDIECQTYLVDPSLLSVDSTVVTETLYSDLLKSNCLVTGQPDWGSVQIKYTGRRIHPEGLLKYIISFRNHNEFHEQCVERIFMDIMQYCQPESLSVLARYTRRGGLDINPYRSSHHEEIPHNMRLIRQ